MTKREITIELDEETVRCLALLGDPVTVLAHIADSAADGVRSPGQARREQTDQSLRIERGKADVAIAHERTDLEEKTDDIVRIARRRADHTLKTARDDADLEGRAQPTTSEDGAERERTRADTLLADERSSADALLGHERAERAHHLTNFLAVERRNTDVDLIGERAHTDSLIVDQREANEQMVSATLHAQDLAVEAKAAKERAEASERKLLAIAEFRDLFIGILGHDLRNPLGSINMAAALLLRRGNLDEQDAATAARIIRGGQRMTRMIAQLLDLARTRLGGGFPIDPKPTDLREICQNVVDEFEAAIQMEVEGDVTGTWDRDRLAEVLSNLAGNAIDYAAPGTVVTVKARADGEDVVAEISNQGDPIPADLLPFIFEPFRRAREQRKAAAGNLGLGLYIAHQIVISHGGKLEAHSAGGTTTFVMRLPRRPPATPSVG